MSRYLNAGALAGLAAGVAMALVLRLVGEGPLGDAVALEGAARGSAPHDEVFSRAAQQVGGMLGAALYGLAVGLVFAVVFAAVRHRLAARDDWRRSLALAAVGFAAVFAAPFAKYPANPPAVGDPATVGRRTALYLAMLAWSVAAAWGAWRLSRWLSARDRPDPVRLPAAVAAWVVAVVLAGVLLPGNPDPVEAPATLVWRFRLSALAGAVSLWAVLGTVFGWLVLRAGAGRDRGLEALRR